MTSVRSIDAKEIAKKNPKVNYELALRVKQQQKELGIKPPSYNLVGPFSRRR